MAALEGSTWVYIPPVLDFFTLGIEYHHIHHLNTRVPSYSLRACHESVPEEFWTRDHKVTYVGPWLSLVSVFNVMYDEETDKFVPFWPLA